jgi:hypothetical protein
MTWDQEELQRHITERIEEHSELDYKAAASLGKQNDKRDEITKDVSAFANSAGGTIIYGIKELAKPNNHLPEKLDPIDRTQFSKEWLETIINTIRPRITNVIVTPVSLASGSNDVCYVVEVPQGATAHQARDLRYYRRYNFESVPMEDYEIRDIMNRATVADASIEFGSRLNMSMGTEKHYLFLPRISNSGNQIINNFKLSIVFPRKAANQPNLYGNTPNLIIRNTQTHYHIDYYSTLVLFPQDEIPIGEILQWVFSVNDANRLEFMRADEKGETLTFSWTLFADNMPPKHGTYPIKKLLD